LGEPVVGCRLFTDKLLRGFVINSTDVVKIVALLESASIAVWLDGGWGVDALIGEQTRSHNDLDIVIRQSDVPRLRETLEHEGFREKTGGTLWNFVLVDESGREVDVHTVRFDAEGNGLYGPSGQMYLAGTLDGIGKVGDMRVQCKTAEAQMAERVGYKWKACDYHDVLVLEKRLGIPIPTHYDVWRPDL